MIVQDLSSQPVNGHHVIVQYLSSQPVNGHHGVKVAHTDLKWVTCAHALEGAKQFAKC